MTSRATSGPAVRLRPLIVIEDATEFVVSDPEAGTFISVPPIGAVVIHALQRGASLDEAAAEAEQHAGEPVDVVSFVQALDDVGFLAAEDAGAEPAPPPGIQQNAPIQQRHWVAGPDAKWVRPFFSPAAWITYAAALAFSVVCFILNPSLFPRPNQAFVSGEPGPSILALIPLSYALTALHECWHWLAARAAGLSARFGVDRRLCFLVFETDLSQLWTLPRWKRYGPQLAGLAFDATILALLLAFRLLVQGHHLTAPPILDNLAAALILVTVLKMTWQGMIFLRTDLYGVFVTRMGCYNLWEVKSLLLRRAFGRLSPEQADQLAEAHPRDVTVARWFRWVYILGAPMALAYYAAFTVPILASTGQWVVEEITTSPADARFWTALVTSIAVYAPPVLVLAIWCRQQLHRLRTRAQSSRP